MFFCFCCRCIFSVGGDGALHVLDDADAIGYVKPSATRHHTLKKSFLPQTTTRPAGWDGGDPIRPCSRASSAIAPSTAAERRCTSASIRGCESNRPGAIPDKVKTRYAGGRRAVTDAGCGASDEEDNARKGDGRRGVNELMRHQAKHHDDGRYEDVEQAELSRANGGAGGGGGGGGDGGGRSVLLRQIVFASSSNSDVDEEGNQSAQGVKHAKKFPPKAQGLVGAPSGVSNIDMHTATASSFGGKEITSTNVLNSDHPEARAKRGEVLKTPTYAAKPEVPETWAKQAFQLPFPGAGRRGDVGAEFSREGSSTLSDSNGRSLPTRQRSTVDMSGHVNSDLQEMNGERAPSTSSLNVRFGVDYLYMPYRTLLYRGTHAPSAARRSISCVPCREPWQRCSSRSCSSLP